MQLSRLEVQARREDAWQTYVFHTEVIRDPELAQQALSRWLFLGHVLDQHKGELCDV